MIVKKQADREKILLTTRRNYLKAMAAGAITLGTGWAHAQDKSPIRILSAGAAGSGSDFTVRAIADRMREKLDRPVVVEIKPGVGQRVAIGELLRAKPDGRTLLFFTDSAFTLSPHIYRNVGYDAVRDFTPVAGIGTFDMGVATGPMTSAADMRKCIEWLLANRDNAFYGTPGTGSLPQFIGVELGNAINVKMQHVPYKDWNMAVSDLISGRIPLLIHGLSTMLEMHRARKLRIVAVTGDARSPLVPDVPTLRESGVPVTSVVRMGIMGPSAMPQDLVSSLNGIIMDAAKGAAFRDSIAKYGVLPSPSSASERAQALATESQRLQRLVKASGHEPE